MNEKEKTARPAAAEKTDDFNYAAAFYFATADREEEVGKNTSKLGGITISAAGWFKDGKKTSIADIRHDFADTSETDHN